jgi:hypothetical protein
LIYAERTYFYNMNLFNRPLLICLLGIVIVAGCDEPPKKHSNHHSKDTAAAERNTLPPPDIFVAAPHTIEGCVGLYTYDSLKTSFDNMDVDKGKKILATKTAEFAFLRYHGKVVDKTTNREVYRGSGFVVVLQTQVIQVKGEEMLSTGTLEIIQGDKRIKIKISGVAGC